MNNETLFGRPQCNRPSQPAHGEGAEEGNRYTPWYQRLAQKVAARRKRRNHSPQTNRGQSKSASCRHQSTGREKRASNGAGTCSIPTAPATIRVDTKASPRVFG